MALICCIAVDSVLELIKIFAKNTLLLTFEKLAAVVLCTCCCCAYALITLVERIVKAVDLKIYNIVISYLVSNLHNINALLTKR